MKRGERNGVCKKCTGRVVKIHKYEKKTLTPRCHFWLMKTVLLGAERVCAGICVTRCYIFAFLCWRTMAM